MADRYRRRHHHIVRFDISVYEGSLFGLDDADADDDDHDDVFLVEQELEHGSDGCCACFRVDDYHDDDTSCDTHNNEVASSFSYGERKSSVAICHVGLQGVEGSEGLLFDPTTGTK
eukprot:scaffold51049_cov35-Attheya_sp.AAC.2